MEIKRRVDSERIENGSACVVYEYPLEDKDINIAFAEIRGKFPEDGWAMNEICKEMAYVVRGRGIIVTPDQKKEFNQGDVLLIKPGEKYYWEGNFDLIIPCSPAWYPEQHKLVK